jgi:hypothetical protein
LVRAHEIVQNEANRTRAPASSLPAKWGFAIWHRPLDTRAVVTDSRRSLRVLMPFGLGQQKPHHFRDMARVAWQNRDNLGYAWKVLSQGVCDGCALGVAGFHDWTIDGVHLCMTRLNLLRLNTMPPISDATLERLADVSHFRDCSNEQLRELGRLPCPMLRSRGAKGFARISWDEALRVVGSGSPHPIRIGWPFISPRAG